jgi:hypothetical protein
MRINEIIHIACKSLVTRAKSNWGHVESDARANHKQFSIGRNFKNILTSIIVYLIINKNKTI